MQQHPHPWSEIANGKTSPELPRQLTDAEEEKLSEICTSEQQKQSIRRIWRMKKTSIDNATAAEEKNKRIDKNVTISLSFIFWVYLLFTILGYSTMIFILSWAIGLMGFIVCIGMVLGIRALQYSWPIFSLPRSLHHKPATLTLWKYVESYIPLLIAGLLVFHEHYIFGVGYVAIYFLGSHFMRSIRAIPKDILAGAYDTMHVPAW
jgi:hypothetical protein